MASQIPHYGAPVSRGAAADLGANLWCGLRAVFLLVPALRHWRPFVGQVVLLTLLDVAVSTGFNWLETGGEGVFNFSFKNSKFNFGSMTKEDSKMIPCP